MMNPTPANQPHGVNLTKLALPTANMSQKQFEQSICAIMPILGQAKFL